MKDIGLSKRERMLDFINNPVALNYVPAAFFMHFDSRYHSGQAAIDKHLEFYTTTGMDFVKVQYEQIQPPAAPIRTSEDWARAPLYPDEFFEPTVRIVEGLVNAVGREALVILTLYSPFMWTRHFAGNVDLTDRFKNNPDAVKKALEIMTANVLRLVRLCQKVGVDGFYASSQGGESDRFGGTDIFEKYIKPSDLAVWDEIEACKFNVLHICDYDGEYDDLSPFLDYPGAVVNCSLKLGSRNLTPREVSRMFERPFMGGLERLGVLATGSHERIRQAARNILADAPERFILAADCTVPSATPWENLRAAIETAHKYRQKA